jgi:hypothetical protein
LAEHHLSQNSRTSTVVDNNRNLLKTPSYNKVMAQQLTLSIILVIVTLGLTLGVKRHDHRRLKASTMTVPRELIVNGDEVNHASFPFFAHGNGCGAALIHPDILVSAAHCQGAFNYGLIMIDEEGQEFNRIVEIESQVRYEKYDLYASIGLTKWDIMIMKLAEPIYDIVPIAWNNNDGVPTDGELLSVIGYGQTELEVPSDVLRQAEMIYLDPDTCISKVEDANEEEGVDITPELVTFLISNDVMCTYNTEADDGETCFVSFSLFR